MQPFSITPNPDALYLTPALNAVIRKTEYVVNARQGLTCILGSVGVGKSSILRRIHSGLYHREDLTLCLITNPSFATDTIFLKSLCVEFGLPTRRSTFDQEQEFKRFLFAEHTEGRTVVILIDEAQRLSGPMLERVRAFLNFETATEKLIQIVLCGEEHGLNLKLEEPSKKGLKSRIVTRSTLTSLSPDEVLPMIEYRCRTAGVKNPFTEEQIMRFYSVTTGTPRGILSLCGQVFHLYGERPGPVPDELIDAILTEWEVAK